MTSTVLAVALVGIPLGILAMNDRLLHADAIDRNAADLVIAGAVGTPGLPRAIHDEAAAAPDVAEAVPVTDIPAHILPEDRQRPRAIDVSATDLDRLGSIVSLELVSGALDAVGHDAAVLDEATADRLDAGIGDRLTVALPDGRHQRVHVAAIATSTGQLAGVVLADRLVEPERWAAFMTNVYLDAGSLDASPAGVADSISTSSADILHARDWLQGLDSTVLRRGEGGTAETLVLVGVPVILAVAAMANHQLMSLTARREEFSELRRVGATPGQRIATAAWEALLLTGIGVLLGVLAVLAATRGLARALPWAALLPVALGAMLVAAAASTLRLWTIVRSNAT